MAEQEGKADGYVHTDKLDDLMDAFGSGKWQKLCHKTTSELYLEDCFPSLYVTCVLSHATSRVSSLYLHGAIMSVSPLHSLTSHIHYCRDRLAAAKSSSLPLH